MKCTVRDLPPLDPNLSQEELQVEWNRIAASNSLNVEKMMLEKAITPILETYEGSELSRVINELFSELLKCPEDVRIRVLERLNVFSELVRFEQGIASGAVISILLKPSQTLLDLCFAVRTRNFDWMIIERSHCFSSVGSGSLELPILSTLEKLPIGYKE